MKISKNIQIAAVSLSMVFAAGTAKFVFADAAADAEKAKAMAEPYANDLGPEELDPKILKTYSAKAQAGYKVFMRKCTTCHSAARPLNSQFVEVKGKKKKLRKAAVAKLKKSRPDLFDGKDVWQIEDSIWRRFVKRMMNKPGCNINDKERKQILSFLIPDSRARKMGKNEKKWKAHREKLLSQLKNHKDPKFQKRYAQLYEKHKKKKKAAKKK